MNKLISTNDAAKIIGSSRNFIHQCFRTGELIGEYVDVGSRKFLKIDLDSATNFKPSNRVGRELYSRTVKREPKKVRGYVRVHLPTHPSADCDGYVNQHQLVMEESLGRYLVKGEVIHHINRVRDDNRIENLTLYASMGAHMKEEHSEFMGLVLKIRGSKFESEGIAALKLVLGL
jgi:hypothetical protein